MALPNAGADRQSRDGAIGRRDMKARKKTIRDQPRDASSMLSQELMGLLVDAALEGHNTSGRGVLAVRTDTHSLVWTYMPVAECGAEFGEWADLEPLLAGYDPSTEVVIVLNNSGEFFRVPVAN